MIRGKSTAAGLASFLVALAVLPGLASGADFYLRAEAIQVDMPDPDAPGSIRKVPMWAFAQDSSFGAGDGTPTVPGPALTVPTGDTTVNIHLDNNLSQPISVVIPGQIAKMVPVRHAAGKYAGRIKSFTKETPAGNTTAVTYTWTNFRAGTFLYHSGTHAAIQVQMGLYGSVKRDAGTKVAYAGVPYDTEVTLLFSAIDPNMHDAVSTGNYGDGKAVTSPVGYTPRYFLINGKPYMAGAAAIPAGKVNDKVLVRCLSASLRTHAVNILGLNMTVHAEDGFKYKYPRRHFSLMLPALKTKDAIVTPTAAGKYAVFDAAMHLTNGRNASGGMLTYIEVAAP
jgi:FtsP/CotA-like multicopper oxidase with cupredoxin domain